jgi:hypothetical protein
MLYRRRTAQIQADHFVPEVATPKEPVAYFDVLVAQRDGIGVFLSIYTDAQVVDEAEGKPAICPRLRGIAEIALLSAEEEEALDGGDRAHAVTDLLKHHAPGMLSEDGPSLVRLIEEPAHVGIHPSPAHGMRQHGIEKRVRVVGPHGLHVA